MKLLAGADGDLLHDLTLLLLLLRLQQPLLHLLLPPELQHLLGCTQLIDPLLDVILLLVILHLHTAKLRTAQQRMTDP